MRSFGVVDEKLSEADFFCERVAAAGANFLVVRHYFSAFVGASRSVTFAMQGSISDLPGFKEWYAGWQDRLRADKLARFFHDCRTDSQHLGLSPIMGGGAGPGAGFSVFGQPEAGWYAWIPDVEVAVACRMQMRTTCELVADCYQRFGLEIDPDQVYSPRGMTANGWSLEDIEEQLGFPRGYTDIPWDGPDKDMQRLNLLRRQVALSGVDYVLDKYLDEREAGKSHRIP